MSMLRPRLPKRKRNEQSQQSPDTREGPSTPHSSDYSHLIYETVTFMPFHHYSGTFRRFRDFPGLPLPSLTVSFGLRWFPRPLAAPETPFSISFHPTHLWTSQIHFYSGIHISDAFSGRSFGRIYWPTFPVLITFPRRSAVRRSSSLLSFLLYCLLFYHLY
jgi:hypothetical protein